MTVRAPDCGEVIRELWDWLDQEMEPERWQAFRVHLEACTGCASHKRFAESFLVHVAKDSFTTADVGALRERVRSALHRPE